MKGTVMVLPFAAKARPLFQERALEAARTARELRLVAKQILTDPESRRQVQRTELKMVHKALELRRCAHFCGEHMRNG